MLVNLALQALCRLRQALKSAPLLKPPILVFWSGVKFSFKTSFLKQTLLNMPGGFKKERSEQTTVLGLRSDSPTDGDDSSVGNTAVVNGRAVEISAFLAQSSAIIQ